MIRSRCQSPAAWRAQTHALSPSWSRKNVVMLPRIVTVTAVATQPAMLRAARRPARIRRWTWPGRPSDRAALDWPDAATSAWSRAIPAWSRVDDLGHEGQDGQGEHHHDEPDDEDRQEGHRAGGLRPRPAAAAEASGHGGEQDGHDRGEDDRGDDGAEDDRQLGEHDDQDEDDEDPPAEGGGVAQPDRGEWRATVLSHHLRGILRAGSPGRTTTVPPGSSTVGSPPEPARLDAVGTW